MKILAFPKPAIDGVAIASFSELQGISTAVDVVEQKPVARYYLENAWPN